MVRLGDAFSVIRNGASIRQADGAGGLPITRIETISNREIDRRKFGYAGIEDADKYREYILQDGDILMSHINSEKHLGKVALYKKQGNEKIIHGMNLLMLRANKSIVYPPFATYFFATNIFLGQIQKITKKSVNQASFTISALKEIEMDLPTLDEQRKIAVILDKVSDLIAKRRQQLDKLDELVKSRFIELFGVCETYELLQDSNIYISDGNYSSKYPTADEFVEEGVPFIRASNMEMNTIIDDNMYFITREKHAILLKGHVKAGDVLITTRGATIGKIACVPPRHEDSNINAQIVLLRCPKNEYNPLFLSWYLKLKNTQAEIQKLISGSAQPQLPIKRLVQLNLLKPNINLQNQFGAFVEQTEKSKTTIFSSLEKLETLKKALMQEYFG